MTKFAMMVSVVVIGLGLASCQTDQIQQTMTQYVAVVPPDTFYQCPGKPPRPKIPKGGAMMDSQVAEYIVRLDNAHSICSRSLQAIRAFAARSKLSIEKNSN